MNIDITEPNKSLSLLYPRLQEFWQDLKRAIPEAEIFETKRSYARQTFLYEQGRSRSGEIVTYAKAGDSPHNHAMAFDISNVNFSKRESDIRKVLETNLDIAWGADFYTKDPKTKKIVKFPDMAHFQIKNWRSKISKANLMIPLLAATGVLIYIFKR